MSKSFYNSNGLTFARELLFEYVITRDESVPLDSTPNLISAAKGTDRKEINNKKKCNIPVPLFDKYGVETFYSQSRRARNLSTQSSCTPAARCEKVAAWYRPKVISAHNAATCLAKAIILLTRSL
jgi:hypothetical protein